MDGVIRWLELNGFNRASTVREPGDYAVRGGIVDLFAPGMDDAGAARFLRRHAGNDPQLRSGDAAHRRWTLRALDLVPVAEFQLTTETIRRFRTGYVAAFGAADPERPALRGGQRRPPPSRHGALAAAVPRQARHAVRLRAGRAGGARAAGRGRRARAARADRGLLRGAARRRSSRAQPARSTSRCRRTGSISPEAEWARAAEHRGAGAADAVLRCRRRAARWSMSARAPATISRPSAPRTPPTCSMR